MAATDKVSGWKKWLRVAKPDHAPAVLSRRHIYILPTRFGYLFLLVVIAMLFGSINYTLSLGFVLTFLLAGMGNMAMLHTWRNLAHLRVESHHAEPVFAGEDAAFEIKISDTKPRARYAVAAHLETGQDKASAAYIAYADIDAMGHAILKLPLATRQRGWLPAGRISLYTEFPLSLFHVWAYVNLGESQRCLVYPHPAASGMPMPVLTDQGTAGAAESKNGDDDFAGHRPYQYGDSPRRVDWKASSREQGLLTKQFQGEAQSALWLDWATTPGNDGEQRIRQLTRWVMDAHTDRQHYGLRLPRQELLPDSGENHYRACLQALALLELSP